MLEMPNSKHCFECFFFFFQNVGPEIENSGNSKVEKIRLEFEYLTFKKQIGKKYK